MRGGYRVRLESSGETGRAEEALSPLLQREAREAAERWLARFAPVLDPVDQQEVKELKRRVGLIDALQQDEQRVEDDLVWAGDAQDETLLATVRSARAELESRERELRSRIAELAPGSPEGVVNLERLQARLAEAAARREVEEVAPSASLDGRLELQTAPAQPGAVVGAGIFGAGWLSFTVFHMTIMIGGMWRAFGPAALFLLLFYSIFLAVGIGVLYSAWRASCREEIELDGLDLLIRRTNRVTTRAQRYRVDPGARVSLESTNVRQSGPINMELALVCDGGKEIRFASGRPSLQLKRMADQINAYLARQT